MSRLTLAVLTLGFISIVGVAVFLSTTDIPAPSSPIERILPDGRFPV